MFHNYFSELNHGVNYILKNHGADLLSIFKFIAKS